jgi:tRNA dimethylallyltransferase
MSDSNELVRNCWFLTGATASGKSKVSVALAKLLDAEIISMDSMAIYRDMNVGTAKTPVDERDGVPHHLIDVRDPNETFSTSQYRDACLEAIDSIRGHGKEVLFVGGTALYLKTLLRGMFEGPPADWDFRKEVEKEILECGGEFLHERLQMIDPVAAHNIHPNDHRRIIRALEVFKVTGKPISHWQMEFDKGLPAEKCRVFAMRHRRDVLHDRIGARVTWMFENGLVEEVKTLQGKYDELSHTAAQAVGYREVIEFLDGVRSQEETHEKVLIRTRKFARHQETWFRNLSECQWVDLEPDFDAEETAKRILEIGREIQV